MGNTPNFNLPYPESLDKPDGAAQIRDLAVAVDTVDKTQADNIAAFNTNLGLTNQNLTTTNNNLATETTNRTNADSAEATARANADAALGVRLDRLPVRIEAYTVDVPVNGTSAVKTVTFARAFASKPAVTVNLEEQIGESSGWYGRAISIGTTAFNMYVKGPTAAFSANCQWIAAQYTGSQPAMVRATAAEEGWKSVTATCRHAGCPRDGVPTVGVLIPTDPQAWGWVGVECGACGQAITDVVDE